MYEPSDVYGKGLGWSTPFKDRAALRVVSFWRWGWAPVGGASTWRRRRAGFPRSRYCEAQMTTASAAENASGDLMQLAQAAQPAARKSPARAKRTIEIPNGWTTRPYQRDLWEYMAGGGLRACAVWHRRAGKDSTFLNWTAVASHLRRGLYWTLLPTLTQGRKVIWDSLDSEGRRVIDQVFPKEIRSGEPNNSEMKIPLRGGSIFQVVGSDNIDSLVGANPVGVTFSEYALSNPAAWDLIRPILAENKGWAGFPYTPRGRNHGYRLYRMAQQNPAWFCERLTVDDTKAISAEALRADREAGMDHHLIQQEYYCSFEAAVKGSYYGELIEQMRADGRVTAVPYDPSALVHIGVDLGIGDSTAIWWVQIVGKELHWIDYYEASGKSLDHYAGVIHGKPYSYGQMLFPHDAAARELGTGKTRVETLKELEIDATVVPRQAIEDGIHAVRSLLPRSWFDAKKTERGLDCLSLYRRTWDEKNQVFREQPLHDWASHGADAARTLAMGLDERIKVRNRPRPTRANSSYSPLRWRQHA